MDSQEGIEDDGFKIITLQKLITIKISNGIISVVRMEEKLAKSENQIPLK